MNLSDNNIGVANLPGLGRGSKKISGGGRWAIDVGRGETGAQGLKKVVDTTRSEEGGILRGGVAVAGMSVSTYLNGNFELY